MNYKFTKQRIIVASIIIFLIATNPSLQNFKEFKGIEPVAENNLAVRKNYNFVLFSIYQQADDNGYYHSVYYVGTAYNFFQFAYY